MALVHSRTERGGLDAFQLTRNEHNLCRLDYLVVRVRAHSSQGSVTTCGGFIVPLCDSARMLRRFLQAALRRNADSRCFLSRSSLLLRLRICPPCIRSHATLLAHWRCVRLRGFGSIARSRRSVGEGRAIQP